jgi:hypothetical protein
MVTLFECNTFLQSQSSFRSTAAEEAQTRRPEHGHRVEDLPENAGPDRRKAPQKD